MRKSMRTVWALAMGALVPACNPPNSGPTPGPGPGPTPASGMAEWTIMVFLNADNDLEEFSLADFEEMARVGSSDKVNVIVQMDRAPGHATGHGDWKQTLRFRVTRGLEPTRANALEDLGEADMGNPQVLTNFVKWAQAKYPAKRYLLDIWNHGQGWRLRTLRKARGPADAVAAFTKAREEERRRAGLPARPEAGDPLAIDAVPDGTMRYVSSDDTDNNVLFNREIQDSLETLLAGARLDVIGFDACLMAMVETAYALRRTAKVMVASEELEPGAGWDYERWLNRVAANPAMDAAAMGRSVVEAYRDLYSGRDEKTTLSAVDLSKLDALSASISGVADELGQKLAAQRSFIENARAACSNYAPGYGLHGIDFIRFCEEFARLTGDAALRSRFRAVADEAKAAVLATFAGSLRGGNYGSHGLAIYFPRTKVEFDFDNDHDGYLESNPHFPVAFVQEQRWDNFLRAYLGAP